VSTVLRTPLVFLTAGLVSSFVHGGRADLDVCVAHESATGSATAAAVTTEVLRCRPGDLLSRRPGPSSGSPEQPR
jgi:hypothetical protein